MTLHCARAIIYKLNEYRGVEQLVARRAHNPEVVGSNPSPATIKVLESYDFRTFSAFMWLKSSAHFHQNRADPNRDPNADISGYDGKGFDERIAGKIAAAGKIFRLILLL